MRLPDLRPLTLRPEARRAGKGLRPRGAEPGCSAWELAWATAWDQALFLAAVEDAGDCWAVYVLAELIERPGLGLVWELIDLPVDFYPSKAWIGDPPELGPIPDSLRRQLERHAYRTGVAAGGAA